MDFIDGFLAIRMVASGAIFIVACGWFVAAIARRNASPNKAP
jgi:hypothetical protein